MSNCFPPGQLFSEQATLQAFGALVELIIFKDYCAKLRAAFQGDCQTFTPPIGTRADFFDENTGMHRCDHLASFLKFHNSHVNEQGLRDQCLASNPKPLRVKVPDIISHRPGRMEFYEIKPRSVSSIRSGEQKVGWFNVLCNPIAANLPYRPGTAYKPNETVTLRLPQSVLGAAFEIGIHFFWATDGLLLYEICPVVNRPRQGEKCGALLRGAFLATLLQWRSDSQSAVATLEALASLAQSPLQGAVGEANGAGVAAPNHVADVIYVQTLLNDWRGRAALPLIAEDGLYGGETRGAIFAFQQAVTGLVDGRIDPGRQAITALESDHLRTLFTGALAAFDATAYPAADPWTIYHDPDEWWEDELVEPALPATFGEPIANDALWAAVETEVRDYFWLLYP
ncbi:MAG: peptidoglycan-binding domain-containing protein [Caldilineaceae bacterium]